jgi:ABC-type transport system involved in multi-copper enzyme maturation permease subunit
LTNPVVKKEVLLKFRYRRFFWITSMYALLTFISIAFFLYVSSNFAYRTSDLITWLSETARGSFTFLSFWQFVIVSIITLSVSAVAITSEKEQNTLALLFSSQLDSKMVIVGKFLTAIMFNLVIILILLPIFSIIFILGGISLSEILYSSALIFLGTSLFSAIAIFWSTVFKKTIASNVMSYLTALCFSLGPVILPAIIVEVLRAKKIPLVGFKDLLYFVPELFNPFFPLVLLFEKGNIFRGTLFKKHEYTLFILFSCITIFIVTFAFLFFATKILRKKYIKS